MGQNMNNTTEQHLGSSFEDFLREESLLEETTAIATKRVLAWQIAEAMKKQNLTKTEMANKMQTNRASLNRLLDGNDTSLTLMTLAKAAAVLGLKVNIELVVRDEKLSPSAVDV